MITRTWAFEITLPVIPTRTHTRGGRQNHRVHSVSPAAIRRDQLCFRAPYATQSPRLFVHILQTLIPDQELTIKVNPPKWIIDIPFNINPNLKVICKNAQYLGRYYLLFEPRTPSQNVESIRSLIVVVCKSIFANCH